MRIYTAVDEHRVRAKLAVRDWYRAGLITLEQGDRMLHDVRVDVVQTNEFFRVGLGGFTLFVIGALAALANSFVRQDSAIAAIAIIIAIACVCLAEVLARRFRFYRHGVEEALVVAVVLVALSAWRGRRASTLACVRRRRPSRRLHGDAGRAWKESASRRRQRRAVRHGRPRVCATRARFTRNPSA
jgi:hypothetical protein